MKGRLQPLPGVQVHYEQLPMGTFLHAGMPLYYGGEPATVAEKPHCRPDTPVFLYDDGRALCLCCGWLQGERTSRAG